MSDQELDELLYQYALQIRELQLSTVPRQEDLPKYQTSPRFKRRMDRLIRRSKRPAWLNSVLHYTYQAAVIALIVTTVSFSGLMVTSQAFRQQVISIVMEVFDEITEFRFTSWEETQRTPGDFMLSYLPTGMKEVKRETGYTQCYVYFEDNFGNFIELTHSVLTPNSKETIGLDTEDADVDSFFIYEDKATAVSKGLDNTILWTNDDSIYLLSGTVPMEQLKKVAFGLK